MYVYDGMQYDPIQGQGHEPLKVGNSAIFKGYLLPIYNGGWQMTTIPKLGHNTYSLAVPDFLFLFYFFVSRDFEVGSK